MCTTTSASRLTASVAGRTSSPRFRAYRPGRLTHRQREVLDLLAEGWSNAAIAQRLSITERGVVQHISNIYQVLEIPADDALHRRVVAVRRFLELGAAGAEQPDTA